MAAAGAPLIELREVTKRFASFLAVDKLSFSVGEGEIVALLGRTGAGKSTVLNLVMGSIAPDSGSISVAGCDPSRQFKQLRGRIAVSFQTDRLLPWRTAVENAELGLLILNVPKDEARRRALAWLDRVKLRGAEHKYVHELSGGMRQRVSLARALAVDPSIIFLDESFSQLDHATARALRTDFKRIAAEFGKTCLFVTHRIEDAIEIADRALILTQGARIALVEHVTAATRADPAATAAMHERIAQVLGHEDADTLADAAE
ncbi:ATP-binding cassette domain-containing protein [Roseomonas sp. KE2513]|uniref:ABC transporter ATP-binding protein n=1 Tax=Roseomonas sp. KE2513 TaxID=2479202 RepID=UPI0018DFC70C|nr:ATP-binding cassette domain-containing protein [Roseomonas sp. KE2513]MBI0536475.1 ATP-binding cassette domain-containing protein [Roseomonas sp. KE2513]